MYLIILEDGAAFKSKTINEVDKKSADDGYLQILDIGGCLVPKGLFQGKWADVTTYPEEYRNG